MTMILIVNIILVAHIMGQVLDYNTESYGAQAPIVVDKRVGEAGTAVNANSTRSQKKVNGVKQALEEAENIEKVSDAIYRYSNTVLGVIFYFPSAYGHTVSYDVEIGNCPDSVSDDCAQVRAYMTDSTRSYAKLFATATEGYWKYPVGKGGDWITQSMKYGINNTALKAVCSEKGVRGCALFSNNNAHEYVRYALLYQGNYHDVFVGRSTSGPYTVFIFGGYEIEEQSYVESNAENHLMEVRTFDFI